MPTSHLPNEPIPITANNPTGTGWSNCELRSYQFDMSTNATIANATIRETDSSFIRRMHSLNPLSRDEQIQLAVVAQASWAADGYIISAGATEAKDAILDGEDNECGETDPAIDVCLMDRRREERVVEVDGKNAVRANL